MQRYVGAGLRKGDRHAGSQALPGTGDQCVLALEAEEIEDCHETAPSKWLRRSEPRKTYVRETSTAVSLTATLKSFSGLGGGPLTLAPV